MTNPRTTAGFDFATCMLHSVMPCGSIWFYHNDPTTVDQVLVAGELKMTDENNAIMEQTLYALAKDGPGTVNFRLRRNAARNLWSALMNLGWTHDATFDKTGNRVNMTPEQRKKSEEAMDNLAKLDEELGLIQDANANNEQFRKTDGE